MLWMIKTRFWIAIQTVTIKQIDNVFLDDWRNLVYFLNQKSFKKRFNKIQRFPNRMNKINCIQLLKLLLVLVTIVQSLSDCLKLIAQ